MQRALACHHAPSSDNNAAQIANEKDDDGQTRKPETDFFVIILANKVASRKESFDLPPLR
jgi:hypothetical protein